MAGARRLGTPPLLLGAGIGVGPGAGSGAAAVSGGRWARRLAVVGVAALAAGCGSDGGTGIAVRRLQDAALLAEGDPTRCPLDLDLPARLGGGVEPVTGAGAASGTSVGQAPAASSLRSVGGASYRCVYQRDGRPVTLVVVAVPDGQQTAAAVGALTTPLQDAGLDQGAAQALVDTAKGAEPGQGVAAPSGSAAAASASLPGGGAAAVAVVAGGGSPASDDLADAAGKLADELSG